MKYDRGATTVEEQVEILKSRGLIIEDKEFAIQSLKIIGYFRFKGYCLPYYAAKDKFKNGVTFNQIHQNYRFDERFRLLLFQIIEHVEVELKSVISRDFSLETNPMGQYFAGNFENIEYYNRWMENFDRLIDQSAKRRELYTNHYMTHYENKFPIWVANEISDFGSLSKFYSNINKPIRAKIAKENYGVSSYYLANWIYVLSVVRNICAHNGRIYDKILPIHAKLPSKEKHLSNNQAFTAILICKKICLDTEYFSWFKKGLEYLIRSYENVIDISRIGFPNDWQSIL